MLCKIGRFILVVLLVGGVVSALTLKQPPTSKAAFGDRITISNKRFYAGGQRIWINGANTPWHNWNDFGGNFDYNWWDNHFRELRNNGINATRVWITCSGEVGINIDSNGYVSGATSAHWSHLDSLFQIAQNRGVYIMATLMSFDHFKNKYSTYQRWRNWINSDSNIDSYVNNYLIPFLNRYKNNPYLWSIDLMNEPDWVYEDSACGNISWDRLQMYFAKAARAIHENSQVLVTVGMAMPKYNGSACGGCQGNKVSDSALQAKVNDPDARLDFYSSHWYPLMYQYWSSPYHKTPSEYGIATDKLNMIGETPANGVYDSNGNLLYTTTQAYENAYQKGWEGVMGWTSNGVDSYGSMTQLGPATRAFRDNHYDLVFPGGGASPTNTPTPSGPTATPSGNLALNRPATASSTESSAYPASAAVDGNTGTRWSSAFSDPQWIYVDLGATYSISRVVLRWETAYGKAYQIQVSNDASTWTTIYSTTTGDGGVDDLAVSGSGRYVRMYGTTRGTQWGYSLWEFEVYGSGGGPTPTPTRTPTPVSGGLVIYDDATTWENWSWNTTVNFNNTSPVYAGSKSIAVTLNAAWAGFSLRKSPAVSTGGYDRITFWIHGGSSGTRQLRFYTQSQDSSGESSSVNVDAPAGTWTQVTIPLSSLGNPTQIARINLQDRTGASQPVFYVDEIRLVSGSNPTATPAPTNTPTPTPTNTPTPTPAPTNLLTNPGFESGTTGWTCNQCTFSVVTSPVYSGSRAASVTNRAANWAGVQQDIKNVLATNGQGTYTLEAWVRMASGSATAKVTVMVQGSSTSYFGVTCSANSTSWTRCSGTQNITWSGTLQAATFFVETTSGTTSYYADNCVLRR